LRFLSRQIVNVSPEHPQQVLDFFMQGVTGRFVQNCTLSQTDAVGGDDA
jgi:hypothetical protein